MKLTMPIETDVLIIGAGPAGSIAAAMLERAGIRPMVVEKSRFPRFVIGESLLPHCMDLLEEAGLLECVSRQGFMQKNGAVFFSGDRSCNFDFASQFTEGWTYTYQVPRAEFDKALADEVAARGVEIRFGTEVTGVDVNDSHARVTIRNETGQCEEVKAGFVLDCSGFGRVLPRLFDLERPSNFPVKESLFAHVTGDQRPLGRDEGKIWISILPGGAWVWIIPFANGSTSIGVVADAEFLAKYPTDPEERLRAILLSDANARSRLSGMKFVFQPKQISAFACGVERLCGERFALVGNATEFLDPIFSSGVTLALASANRAAKVLIRQSKGESIDWQSEYGDHVMQGIDTFRTYVSAWYDGSLPEIFFAAQANPGILKQVCSVMAGYVWDRTNPYVTQPERALPLLSKIVASIEATRTEKPTVAAFFEEDKLSAYEAKCEAQRIAFAPVVFQSCRVLRDSAILETVQRGGEDGLTLHEIVEKVNVPRYGVKVLLESGLGSGLLICKGGRFSVTKLGYFMLRDPMTRVNMDVVHDVCYRGLFDLGKAIMSGKPAGLKSLGEWPTLYEGLSTFPKEAMESWLAFDHYYSDQAFPAALPIVFEDGPRRLLDVGGNTGRWARHCLRHDPDVHVTIADLPQQLDLATKNLESAGLSDRVEYFSINILDDSSSLPGEHDAIWMSQFLDCFSENEIVSILKRAADALTVNGSLYIMELFWDRQPNETAAFCLQQTSLYFTAMANGNSQMYHSEDMMRCLKTSGLKVIQDRDHVGAYHTLLKCKRA